MKHVFVHFLRFWCRILRPGGIWVNLGPLLYHYSDVSGEGSIEPTYEDLLLIIRGCGFQILVSFFLSAQFFRPIWNNSSSANRNLQFYRKMRPAWRPNMHKIHDRCNRANTWVYFLCAKNRSKEKRTNTKMGTTVLAIGMVERRLAIDKFNHLLYWLNENSI